jgi:hypothetical protein
MNNVKKVFLIKNRNEDHWQIFLYSILEVAEEKRNCSKMSSKI